MPSHVETVGWGSAGAVEIGAVNYGIALGWIGAGVVNIGPVAATTNVNFGGGGIAEVPAVICHYHVNVGFGGAGKVEIPQDMVFADINAFNIINWTVNKSYNDCSWKLEAPVADLGLPNLYKMFRVLVKDYDDIDHCVFLGMVPDGERHLAAAKKTSKIVGWDAGYYLSNQYVPDHLWRPDIDKNPAEIVTELLGGSNWMSVTGINPYKIMTVSNWSTIKKQFDWKATTTKWKAIQDMASLCKYLFVVKWKDFGGGIWYPISFFVPDAIITIDSYLENPATAIIYNL